MDLHTHLREPGREDAETVLTGSRAAALGGFTAVHAMANTDPVADTAGVVEQVWHLGKRAGLVDVFPVGAVTVGLGGQRLAELGAMADSAAGVRVFSDDGRCVSDAVLMRRALEYVKAFDGVIAQHSQEPRLTEDAQMNEGELSGRLGLRGWPAVAEEAIIARDVLLAEHVGSRLHVCHVSTAGSVEIVRWAKSRGHRRHRRGDAAPPAAHRGPRRDLRPGVQGQPAAAHGAPTSRPSARAWPTGPSTSSATDHAPHPTEDKECEWAAAAFGMLGLEQALAVVIETMVDPGCWTGPESPSGCPSRPAAIGRRAGHGRPIAVGEPANLVLVDPDARAGRGPAAIGLAEPQQPVRRA